MVQPQQVQPRAHSKRHTTPGLSSSPHLPALFAQRQHLAGELPPFRFHEINAMRLASPYQAYSVLYRAITGTAAAPKRAAELLDAYFNRPSSSKQCVCRCGVQPWRPAAAAVPA